MSSKLHELTVADAGELIGRHKISPVELIEGFLARIHAVDDTIHSYIAVDSERALRAAREAEHEIMRGRTRGPLHGLPYAIKDTFHVLGMRTTANSRLMLNFEPKVNATVHNLLQDAGAIFLGKLNTYEYGTGTGADLGELPFAPARNPWNTNCFTGGSSTGSGAAVAAGTAMFALGADTGGSVRLPAAGCGLVGLKPTYGLVSRAGMLPNCYSLDHVGCLAKTSRDAAIVLQAIARHDPADPGSLAPTLIDYGARLGQDLSGVCIGIIRRFFERDIAGDPEIICGIEAALEILRELGARVVDIDIPETQGNFLDCARIINNAESYSIHEQDFLRQRDLMGPALLDKFTGGACVAASAYIRAQRWRRKLTARITSLFELCDLIVTSGAVRLAPRIDDSVSVANFTSESAMAPFSLAGTPALTVCTGYSKDGRPLNMQIAAPVHQESLLLQVTDAYEKITQWHRRQPPCSPRELDQPFAATVSAGSSIIDSHARAIARARATEIGMTKPTPRDLESLARQSARMAATVARLPVDLDKTLEPAVVFVPVSDTISRSAGQANEIDQDSRRESSPSSAAEG